MQIGNTNEIEVKITSSIFKRKLKSHYIQHAAQVRNLPAPAHLHVPKREV